MWRSVAAFGGRLPHWYLVFPRHSMKRKLGGFDEPESMSGSNATEVGAASLSDGGAGAPQTSGACTVGVCVC